MKHLPYMVIVMTSWLSLRGQCSSTVKVNCDDQRWEGQYLYAHCIIDFSASTIIDPTSCIYSGCYVNGKMVKCNTTTPASKPKETKKLIVIPWDLVKINQEAELTLKTDCAGPIQSPFHISKVEMKCEDTQALDGHAVHAHCVVDYSQIAGSCNFKTKFRGKEVTYNITSTNKTKIEELIIGIPNVNIKQHEMTVNLTLSLHSDCAAPVESTFTVNFINTDKSVGKEDNRHQALLAIGIVIVIVIIGLVLFKLKRHRTYSGSSSLKLWKRTPSADTDVESNDDSSSRQDSDSEPLSGGQELRDTHTPPATSHTDDASS